MRIGGVLAVAGDSVAVGRPRRRAVRRRAGPASAPDSCSASSSRLPARLRIPRARGRPPSGPSCRAPPASTPRSRRSLAPAAPVAAARWAAQRAGARAHGSARWASRRSCARCAASARSRGGGRLVLGRHGGRLLHAEHRHALVAFGPPQSGKSAGLAIPALLEWEGPAVASLDQDRPARRHGRAAASARRGVRVRPVRALAGAGRTRGRRCTAPTPGTARSRSPGGSPRPASSTSAASRAATSGRSPPSSGSRRCCTPRRASGRGHGQRRALGLRPGRRASSTQALDAAAGARARRGALDAHAAYDAVRAFEAQADRTRTSIEATAQALLRAYRFARVARSAAAMRDHRRTGCSTSAATLYLIGDAKASKLLRPIFLALLVGGGRPRLRARDDQGGRLEQPLLALPRRGGQRGAAAEPRRDRLDRAEPQHPAGLDLPRPRPGPQPLRPAGRDGRQQPPGADAAARASPTSRRSATSPGCRRGGGARAERDTTGAGGATRSTCAPAPAADRARGAAPAARRACAAAVRPARRPRRSGCECGSRTGACAGWREARRHSA